LSILDEILRIFNIFAISSPTNNFRWVEPFKDNKYGADLKPFEAKVE